MELEKIKKGVYAELPRLLEVVKAGAIEKEMNEFSGWISLRLRRLKNGPNSFRAFRDNDVEKLNQGIWQLGEKLMNTTIVWNPDRKECVANVKQGLKSVFIKEIARRKLGITKSQMDMYMSVGGRGYRRSLLSEEQVESLTMGVREVGLQLLSTEFYLDEE